MCLSVNFMETLHALAGIVAGAELPAEEEQRLHGYFQDVLPKVCVCAVWVWGWGWVPLLLPDVLPMVPSLS